MGQGVGPLKGGGGWNPLTNMGFTKFYGKSAVRIFPIFSCKVTGAYRLKTDLNYFFGKNLTLRFFESKQSKNGPKIWFFKSYEESMHGTSDFLHEIKAPERLKIE